MFLNTIEVPRPSKRAGQTFAFDAPAGVQTLAPLPPGFAFTDRTLGALRHYLETASLGHYKVFYHYTLDVEMNSLDEHLDAIGEEGAAWKPLPSLSSDAETYVINAHVLRDNVTRIQLPGCINLPRHSIVMARWFWIHAEEDCLRSVWMCAAPTFDHYVRLRDELRAARRAKESAEWRIFTGSPYNGCVARATGTDANLMLHERVRGRIDAEVFRFFSDEAKALYDSLGVPYRRGVLMHGPPGNGKTSLIRWIGEHLPNVPGFILRPGADFDSDDLATVFKRWTENAPAILVIEDLDWLLKSLDVSAFLNLIDGIDSSATGGLLLIATTNHPEKLDPAVNNRPGRFDVVIEIPSPDEATRLAYLREKLPEAAEAVLVRIAADGEGLAFAHLQEIVRLSGLLAINAGRTQRTRDDVINAAQTVRDAYDDAVRGFPGKPEIEFGLAHLHRARRGDE